VGRCPRGLGKNKNKKCDRIHAETEKSKLEKKEIAVKAGGGHRKAAIDNTEMRKKKKRGIESILSKETFATES